MPFISLTYLIFVIILLPLYWGISRVSPAKKLLLLIANYFFYSFAQPHYLILLLFSSTLNYIILMLLENLKKQSHRKLLLILIICYHLGILIFFKYTGFLLNQLGMVFNFIGIDAELPSFYLFAPLGISFFTFQSIGYMVDSYRRPKQFPHSFLDSLIFVSFFPHITSGPIPRAENTLTQLQKKPVWSDSLFGLALFLIALGLIKKLAIADYLSLQWINDVYDKPFKYSSLEILFGAYSYSLQIYYDFSGYTDLVMGTALLFGIQLPLNFNSPYKSQSPREFWRRWHISLSTWLRDYLYIPLGGSRNRYAFLVYVNLLITMTLAGIWHGAGWTFLIWGFLHGVGLCISHFLNRKLPPKTKHQYKVKSAYYCIAFMKIFFTFHFVTFTWIFFRAPDLDKAREILIKIQNFFTQTLQLSYHSLFGNERVIWDQPEVYSLMKITPVLALIFVLGLVLHFFPDQWFLRIQNLIRKLPGWLLGLLFFLVLLTLYYVSQENVTEFIYYSF